MKQNGLEDAVMGFSPFGGYGNSEQLSQTTSLFHNMRWYLVTNQRQPLSEAYAEIGLIQTIVDIPVDDGLRGGVIIKSNQLSPEQIVTLQEAMEQEGDLTLMGQSLKWTRLFGGGGVLIITGEDPATPFKPSKMKEGSPLEFRSLDLWELFWDSSSASMGQIKEIRPALIQDEYFNYYGQKIHKSRVMVMKGIEPPSFIRPRLQGWGLSVVETLIRSINQYNKTQDLVFEVLDEFKVDWFKIKNLTQTLLSPDGQEMVRRRIQLANYQKNYQNAVTMDSEDDFGHKELSFTGIAETMEQIRMQVAADLRMPMSKIFGTGSTGFSSGEDDLEVYYGMVESQVRTKSKIHLITMVKIRCQNLFGVIPDDITVQFPPLRTMSAKEQEEVKTAQHTRLVTTLQAGAMSPSQFRQACNKQSLLGIELDESDDTLDASALDTNEIDDEESAGTKKGQPSEKTPVDELGDKVEGSD